MQNVKIKLSNLKAGLKTGLMLPVVLASGFAMPAMAEHQDEYFDNARVISVTPQTERVNNPRQECRTEYIRENTSYDNNYQGGRSNTGAIIGGISGGLLGSQIGRGSGRVAAAAVGAGLGAIVGDRVDNNQRNYNNQITRSYERPVERCTTVDNWQTISRGYLVNYRYNGRTYTTTSPNDPGDNIRVRVAVTEDDRQRVSYAQPQYIIRSNYDDDDHDDWRDNRKHDKRYKHNNGRGNDRRYW